MSPARARTRCFRKSGKRPETDKNEYRGIDEEPELLVEEEPGQALGKHAEAELPVSAIDASRIEEAPELEVIPPDGQSRADENRRPGNEPAKWMTARERKGDGHRKDGVADIEPGQSGCTQGGHDPGPCGAAERSRAQSHAEQKSGGDLGEDQPGEMDDGGRQADEPRRALSEDRVFREFPHQTPHLANEKCGQERHEERGPGVSQEPVGREDQDREAQRVERVDLALGTANTEMWLQRAGKERGIPLLPEILIEGKVMIANQAFRHHKVLGLVAVRSHPILSLVGDARVQDEEDRQQEFFPGPDPRRDERESQGGEGESKQGPARKKQPGETRLGEQRSDQNRARGQQQAAKTGQA